MSLRKRRNLLLLAVFHFIMLAAFLPGCKEGTKTSPVSSLLITDSTVGAQVDLSGSPEAVHTISGSVSSQNTSENLSNIKVVLLYNKSVAGETITTADGRFYFAKIPPGLYEINFSHPEGIYSSTSYVIRVLEDGKTQPEAPSIKLVATNPERLKIQAKIEGEIILFQAGTKLANINVELEDSNGMIISAALTSAVGQFSFDGIGTGTYKIKAGKASAYDESIQTVTVRDDGVVSPRYSVITLTAKAVEKKYPLIGTVVSFNTGEKLGNISAVLMKDNTAFETTKTTSDGQFYFSKVSAGLYDIGFYSTNNLYKPATLTIRLLDDGKTQPAAPLISLEAVNIGNIEVKAKIEGEIVVSGTGAKIANINVELEDSKGALISTALSSSGGQFFFDNIGTGTYTIKAGKASSYLEAQQNVTIRTDGVVSPRYVIVPMTSKPVENFSISGFVKNQTKAGLANLEVSIFDDINLSIPSAQATRTTGEGKFFFENLKEARMYYLKVAANLPNSEASEVYPVRVLSNGTTSPAVAEIFVNQSENINLVNIEGKVYDAFTGGPLEYANIKVADLNVATTDTKGMFGVMNLVPGSYKIEISKFGYETLVTSFLIRANKTTVPASLTFPLLHSMKTGYGSIAGRFVDESTSLGIGGLTVKLFKWKQVTKQTYVTVQKIVNNQQMSESVLVTETDWEWEKEPVLTSKTSVEGETDNPDIIGSFKLTHLTPGYYLVYLADNTSNPAEENESRGGYFTWRVPSKGLAGYKTQIRGLQVFDGRTTYWTNYEQAYK